ncbi:MAG: polysaccharide pyruvyl transferase family protein [Terricaulis sp.]
MRAINAYWWADKPNFGDALTPLLLQSFGFEVIRTEPESADVCVIGSVLQRLESFRGAVIGSGFISDGEPFALPSARLLALRGPLSAARAGLTPNAYGDAGLLAPRLFSSPSPRAQMRIGVIPHYVDENSPVLAVIAERHTGAVRIIDVKQPALEVIKQICECETILSSSLHGLVVAEAFGRRTCWLQLSDRVIGEGFKFRDHYAALGVTAAPRTINGAETIDQLDDLATLKSFDLAHMQRALEDCFYAL